MRGPAVTPLLPKMNRTQELLRFVRKDQVGLEIAPYFNPLTPKAQGFRCESVDVFDTDRLRQNAAADPALNAADVARIEDVDHVFDACQLGDLRNHSPHFGAYAFVVSSHNFEHLPNPIKFLQGAYDALAPGGMLSMAIPDYRACFDYFRFPTRLNDWLRAFHEDHRAPTPYTHFDVQLNGARILDKRQHQKSAFALGLERRVTLVAAGSPEAAYQSFLDPSPTYQDTHCQVLCPETFHLLIADAIALGLVQFEIWSISHTNTYEFYVHLRKPLTLAPPPPLDRLALLTAAKRAIGLNGFGFFAPLGRQLTRSKKIKAVLRRLRGQSPYLVAQG